MEYNATLLNYRQEVTFGNTGYSTAGSLLPSSSTTVNIEISPASTLSSSGPVIIRLETSDPDHPTTELTFTLTIVEAGYLVLPASPFVQDSSPDYSTLHVKVEGGAAGRDQFTVVSMTDTELSITLDNTTRDGIVFEQLPLVVIPSRLNLTTLKPAVVEVRAAYTPGSVLDDGSLDTHRFGVHFTFGSSPRSAWVLLQRLPGPSTTSSVLIIGPTAASNGMLLVPSYTRPSRCPALQAVSCVDIMMAGPYDTVCAYYSVPAGTLIDFSVQERDPIGNLVPSTKTAILSPHCLEDAVAQGITIRSTPTSQATTKVTYDVKVR